MVVTKLTSTILIVQKTSCDLFNQHIQQITYPEKNLIEHIYEDSWRKNSNLRKTNQTMKKYNKYVPMTFSTSSGISKSYEHKKTT